MSAASAARGLDAAERGANLCVVVEIGPVVLPLFADDEVRRSLVQRLLLFGDGNELIKVKDVRESAKRDGQGESGDAP